METRKNKPEKRTHVRPSNGTLTNKLFGLGYRGLARADFLLEVSRLIFQSVNVDFVRIHILENNSLFSYSFEKKGRRVPDGDIIKQDLSDDKSVLRDNYESESLAEIKKSFPSVISIPLNFGEEKTGNLYLAAKKKNYFNDKIVPFIEELSGAIVLPLIHRRTQTQLRERIKELACLRELAKISSDFDVPIDEMLDRAVNLLPPSWLYPESAEGRIRFDDKVYKTRGFKPNDQMLRADIIIDDKSRGSVEVIYKDKKPPIDEGPFLKEERNLIDVIAQEISLIIEKKLAEEDKEKLNSQIQHADRLATLGQLAAGVAHELNEPIGNILGFAELSLKTEGIPVQLAKDLKTIIEASLHAREVIKKLLVFSRQNPFNKDNLKINKVIEEGLYFFEARCSKQGISLIKDLAGNLPAISADPSQINQVLINLVVNAIHAMPAGGKLKVKTYSDSNYVFLNVEDTGCGIRKDILDKIFLPFFTTKDIDEGTGLGLAVTHGIVVAHGGKIEVESKEGKGSLFKVAFPISTDLN